MDLYIFWLHRPKAWESRTFPLCHLHLSHHWALSSWLLGLLYAWTTLFSLRAPINSWWWGQNWEFILNYTRDEQAEITPEVGAGVVSCVSSSSHGHLCPCFKTRLTGGSKPEAQWGWNNTGWEGEGLALLLQCLDQVWTEDWQHRVAWGKAYLAALCWVFSEPRQVPEGPQLGSVAHSTVSCVRKDACQCMSLCLPT